MNKTLASSVAIYFLACILSLASVSAASDWPQLQGNALRSGNAPETALSDSLGLLAAIPMTDGIYASPVVSDGSVYVIDGSGVVFAIDATTFQVRWRLQTAGGAGNCNNVAAPAVVGEYLHVGTTAGYYYVLNRETGAVVKQIDCREPIFSAPAVGAERVYFATLGARVYAVEPSGEVAWTWDFVKEVVKFDGNRWSGEEWLAARGDRVTWKDHFVCSRDICLVDKTVVMPAGGRTVFLDDAGAAPKLRAVAAVPDYAGSEFPATFGQSADDAGNVYVQWHRRDNAGRVEILRLAGDEVQTSYVQGTETAIHLPGLLSFASVSVRGRDVYRVRPEEGIGLCRHTIGNEQPEVLCAAASVCPPVVTRDHVMYGGLDGKLYVVPLAGGEATALATAFKTPITAPIAVADGRIYAGCEDGYLYVYGEAGKAALPTKDLQVAKIRSPLTDPFADARYDWYTNYGDFGGTNANQQGLKPPLRMRWARRLEGTVKHLPVCGGGRLYTHTAEGQIIAVEQDTGRLLWRRHWPDVYLSFTSPLYIQGKLLVPQAGIKRSLMRCLDAATGELLWEAPFTGSPSWSRQFPPVVHGNVAIYASGSGEYAAQGTERPFTFKGEPIPQPNGREVMAWIYSNENPYYPKDHHPRIWAWDLDTGKVVWEKDFYEYGRGGNDCGICMLDGKLFYSTFFGYAASQRQRRGLPADNNGLTACLDPETGEVIWKTTDFYVTSKCTLSARDGRLYIGGYNRAIEGTDDRFVWCLDAKDGSLVWKSDAVTSALNVVTVGEEFIFSNALRGKGNVFDRTSGKVVSSIGHNYACCRFTLSEPYVLGANMDMIDLSSEGKLVSTGPAIDSRECLGAVVSNGRIFYTSQASGFVVSQTYGEDSRKLPAVWERE
ncbi:MAG: PQQ-binding-like beta-propeller repeat protein [Planctomycetota bacterium]|nr:PQQ-binding-like beta-propeller repeat protein [Planctomycetota bacterium]